MKRIFAFVLCLLMLPGCVSALAEEAALSTQMNEITRLVKTTLEISDDYGTFNAEKNGDRWYLRWSDDDRWAEAVCDEQGTILMFDQNTVDYGEGSRRAFDVGFPTLTPEELQSMAGAFLDRVVKKGDISWTLERFTPALRRGSYPNASAQGELTLRGLTTDIVFTINLNPMTGMVTGFYRSDCYSDYLPLPEDDPAKLPNDGETRKQAREKLLDAHEMEIVYLAVDPKEAARLVYVLKNDGRIALDAKTGEIVSFHPETASTSAAKGADYGLREESENDAKDEMRRLTETELKGIALYDDVLSSNELDGRLRAMPELILDEKYTLASVNYGLSNEKPYAYLCYYKMTDEDEQIELNAMLDARSGQLQSIYTYSTKWREKYDQSVDTNLYAEAAQQFIANYCGDKIGQVAPTSSTLDQPLTGDKPVVRYSFGRVHAGYPFRANGINLSFDAESGKVCGFSLMWNEEQAFVEPESEMISLAKARRLWTGDGECELMYLSVPVKQGREVKYALTLCRAFETIDGLYALDAVSGEAYKYETKDGDKTYEYSGDEPMLYDDEVRCLGQYGIGLTNRRFDADEKLTYADMAVLALETVGYPLAEDMTDEEKMNQLKNRFSAGEGAKPDDIVSRYELMRTMVVMAGYGDAADLLGIYTCDAADWDSITEQNRGTCAIARALGLIDLNEGKLDPDAEARTADCAHAIYALLDR